jgi:hypothetical protein
MKTFLGYAVAWGIAAWTIVWFRWPRPSISNEAQWEVFNTLWLGPLVGFWIGCYLTNQKYETKEIARQAEEAVRRAREREQQEKQN